MGTQKLRLVLTLEKNRKGAWTAELLSPDQGNAIVPIDLIDYEGSSIRFEMKVLGSSYDGRLNVARSEISGKWKQNGVEFLLTFKRSLD